MEFEEIDKGPWVLFHNIDGRLIGIISHDFTHDVVLNVSGDFSDEMDKDNYCRALADKLNMK